jgi:hypothetical protein
MLTARAPFMMACKAKLTPPKNATTAAIKIKYLFRG